MGLILTGCGGGGDDPAGGGGNSGGPDAPVLASIGDQDITPDVNRTISLSATDANGDGRNFTYTDLSSASPFDPPSGMQAMWTTGVNSATFSWTPTVADDGEYSIRFTVTDDSTNAYSDSETVKLTVMGPLMTGKSVYLNNNCDSCHGATGEGAPNTNVTPIKCAIPDGVIAAVATGPGSMSTYPLITNTESTYISNWLNDVNSAACAPLQ